MPCSWFLTQSFNFSLHPQLRCLHSVTEWGSQPALTPLTTAERPPAACGWQPWWTASGCRAAPGECGFAERRTWCRAAASLWADRTGGQGRSRVLRGGGRGQRSGRAPLLTGSSACSWVTEAQPPSAQERAIVAWGIQATRAAQAHSLGELREAASPGRSD